MLVWPLDGIRLFESMIPLGLASLAAVLEREGICVRVLDFNEYRGNFMRDLEVWRPRVVGIGGTTATRRASFQIASQVKGVFPRVPVVYGGPHATFAASDTLRHIPAVDYVLKGEAEWSMLALVQLLLSAPPEIAWQPSQDQLQGIAGLAWRMHPSGEVRETPAQRIEDLSLLPIPARQHFGDAYRLTIDHTDLPADFIVTSRGCPALCDFCSASRMFPGGVRLRPLEQVRTELQWIVQNRPWVKGIKIFDSTFTADANHARGVAQELRALGLKWECELRVDTVDRPLLEHMRDCGCVFVSMGFETTSPELLRKIGKNISLQQVELVLQWCQELGIITKVFFTFGHLDETWEQCLEDLKLMKQLRDRIDLFATTLGIRVYPGTILEKKLRKRGLLPRDFSWAQFRAPRRNWLVLEPGDVMILEQPQLNLRNLAMLIPRLLRNRTVLSVPYLLKMIPYNTRVLWTLLRRALRA